MTNYIFISYAHKDSERVVPVIKKLQESGYNVWYDDGIDPGTEWDVNIATHIVGCSYFIAFMSKAYLASTNCKDELSFARNKEKSRFLVYIEDVELPDEMEMRLGRIQNIFMHRYSDKEMFYRKLFAAPGIEVCKNAGLRKTVERGTGLNATEKKRPESEQTETEEDAAYKAFRQYVDAYYSRGSSECCSVGNPREGKAENISVETKKQENKLTRDDEIITFEPDKEKPFEVDELDVLLAKYGSEAAKTRLGESYYEYGKMLSEGNGVKKDEKRAIEFYRLAALNDHVGACYKIICLYLDGEDVGLDNQKVGEMYYDFLAAQNECAGEMQEQGEISTKTAERIRSWSILRLHLVLLHTAEQEARLNGLNQVAAEKGNAYAQNEVGAYWEEKNDLSKAMMWYEKAAKQGETNAQKSLARLKEKNR